MEETDMKTGDVVVIQEKAHSRARLFMPNQAGGGDRRALLREWLNGNWTIHEIHPPTMEGETTLVSLRPANMPKEEHHIGWPAYSYCTIESSKVDKAKGSAEASDDFDWKAAEEAVRHFESLGEWRGKDRRKDPAGDAVLRESLGEINDREDAKHAAVLRKLCDKAKTTIRAVLADEDLVRIFEDVKDQGHPNTWSHCGQGEVLAMVKELQARRASDKRVATVLQAFGRPDYIPLHADDSGVAHRHVVRVVEAAVRGDHEFESYWRTS